MRTHRSRHLLLASALALAACSEMTLVSLEINTWGGDHIGITITATGGTIEYDCAMGRIDQPIRLQNGRFDVRGVHWPGQGGPIGVDTLPTPRPARYQGSVSGDRMTVTVTLTDKNEVLGTYAAWKGRSPNVIKCL
jgi:hypothetical protein